jgi:hypothetical protein
MGLTYKEAGIIIAAIIVITILLLYGPSIYGRETPSIYGRETVSARNTKAAEFPLNVKPLALTSEKKAAPVRRNMPERQPLAPSGARPGQEGRREAYGPPPGMARAIDSHELPYLYGERGWANMPREYEANTASSISHFIERSA